MGAQLELIEQADGRLGVADVESENHESSAKTSEPDRWAATSPLGSRSSSSPLAETPSSVP
ncbi:MAG TPA: hypothetical protein VL326_18230, partial [Kofleriaceae bacterium]|nr:hypothetical protein [Kofleriaceae bacterium]